MEISTLNHAPALTLVAEMRSRQRLQTEFVPKAFVEVNSIELHQRRSRIWRSNHPRAARSGRRRTALQTPVQGYRYGTSPGFHPRPQRRHHCCGGDIFLEREVHEATFQTMPSSKQNAVATATFESSTNGSAVELAHNPSVPTLLVNLTRVDTHVTALLKTINLTRFFTGALREHLVPAVLRAVGSGHRNGYVKEIIALLAHFRELQRQLGERYRGSSVPRGADFRTAGGPRIPQPTLRSRSQQGGRR